MAVTGVTGKPEVVKLGGAVEERYAYVDGGVFKAGDLIRLSTAGEIVQAGVTTATTGAVHGMALYDVDAEVNQEAPVLMFAVDTIVSIPGVDTVAPEDLSKGSTYTLEVSSNVWGITGTTAAGIATVVDYAATGTPWTDAYSSFDNDATVDNNRVHVKFAQAILDAHGA